MPALFWVDLTALVVSLVISAALLLNVLGTAPDRPVNRIFSIFTLMEMMWIISALFLRLDLYADILGVSFFPKVDYTIWYRLTAFFVALMTILSLYFTIVFLEKPKRACLQACIPGLIIIGVLYFLGLRYEIFRDVRIDGYGLIVDEATALGWVSILFIPFFMGWALVLLWRERKNGRTMYIFFGLSFLLIGMVVRAVFDFPFPVMSIMNTIGLIFISNAVIHRQILNPIRSLNRELRASLEEKEILIKEIHHRVKNNLNVVNSLLNLQADKVQTPDQARKALMQSRDRVYTMAAIHENLYASRDLSNIEMDPFIHSLVHNLLMTYSGRDKLSVEIDAQRIGLDISRAMPVGLILNELVTNAINHAFNGREGGTISIVFRQTGIGCSLIIEDNGTGMDGSFDIETSDTLGFQLVTTLVHQLNGDVAVSRDRGTRYVITFP